jgi:thioredoxin 2
MQDTIHLVCPHCDATNRLPEVRLETKPRCGRCHQTLFDGHPATLTAASFRKHLAQSDIPVLVEFWAPWCGFCRKMAPAYEEAAARLQPRVRLAKINSDRESTLAAQYGVQGLPTLVLFRGGREIARQSGAMTADQIVAWTRAHA